MAPVTTRRRPVKPAVSGRLKSSPAKGRPIRQGVPEQAVANRVAVSTAPALARLLALPRYLVPLLAVVVLFTGLAFGGVIGLVLLLGLAGVLGWFLVAFWPLTPTSGRILRSLVVLGVAAAAIINLD